METCSGPEAADSLAYSAFGDHGTREFFTHVRFHKHEDDTTITVHLLVELYARSQEEATEVLEAAARGRLAITGLDLDGRPLARHCMLIGGEGAFTYKIAYDETYEKCSPGIVGEVDNVRQFMETPGPRWIDSNTARENTSYGRVWKDRVTVQRVAVGTSALGRLAVAALPLLRLAAQWRRAAARRVGLQRRRAPATMVNAPRHSARDVRQAA